MSDISERIARLSPEKRALLESMLEDAGGAARRATIPRLPRHGEPATFPLSFAQQRLWFLDQLGPNSSLYNIFTAWRVRGALNVEALRRTFDTIVARHEPLRTTFRSVDGSPVQVVSAAGRTALSVIDLSGLPVAACEANAQRLAGEEARRSFDLARGPLLRTTLLQLGSEEHVLLLCIHHIVSDGWSMRVLFQEMAELYKAYSTGQSPALLELPVQYADYAVWQRQWLQGEVLEQQLAYWKQQLGDKLPVLELLTDRRRPAVHTGRGARIPLLFPPALTKRLKEQSHGEQATPFMTLLAAWQILLHRYTGQTDIVVGSAIANRNRTEIEPLIGFFVNTLALRTDLSGDPTIRVLLERVREAALGAYAHQDFPFERLVEVLQPARDPGRTPLFQTMFVLQDAPRQAIELVGLTISPFEVKSETAMFDLTLSIVWDGPTALRGSLVYNADLFDAATAARMAGHYQTLLQGIVADPDQRISRLPLLSESERHQLLVEWTATATDYPRDACIHQLFEAQVEQQPSAIAFVSEDDRPTYGELNNRANRVAHYLRRLGVGPETLVALCLDRSAEAVVAMLGVLKAGGAYVPLDPAYPRERLAFMLEDTRAALLLTQERLLETLPESGARVVCLDRDRAIIERESEENPVNRTTAENLAYVMYTSGSTGQPKGACVVHRGVVRLVRNVNYAALGPKEVFLQFAPLSFDASTFEIWGALLNGARLVVVPPSVPSLEDLGDAIRHSGVTTLWLTAALFHQMVDGLIDSFVGSRHTPCAVDGTRSVPTTGVKQLLAGGDVLSVAHVRKFLEHCPHCRLINGYGPTENTTFTCGYAMTDVDQVGQSVSIGRPIANTQVYILDEHLEPMPVGVPGELYAGGDGLARGYLNRPELTAEKFIRHPFRDDHDARLYKTGDRARYRADGNIEFLGRIDQQVKIHGFRVEPGEIESVLSQHPAVRENAVIAREDVPGDKRLVAYVVAQSGEKPTIDALREFLHRKLPDYMIPATFVGLDALPLTASGKLDRRALPALDRSRLDMGHAFVGPSNDVERQLAAMWADLLGLERVGVRDDFFALGGHSLLAVQLFARIEKEFGKKLPLATLFQGASIEQLARMLGAETLPKSRSSLVEIQSQGSKRPLFLMHSMGGELLMYRELATHLGCDRPIYGFHAHYHGNGQTVPKFEELAAHYVEELRKAQPRGPYHLGGYSFGASLAFEMARQLVASGDSVGLLAIIDTGPALRRNLAGRVWRGVLHFFRNLPNWIIDDLLQSKPAEILVRARRKVSARGRRLRSMFRNEGKAPRIVLADIFDVQQIPQGFRRPAEFFLQSWNAFVWRPYAGRVTLFRARTRPLFGTSDRNLNWSRLANGGVDVEIIPGHHDSMMKEPHVRVLAERLRAALDSVDRNISNTP